MTDFVDLLEAQLLTAHARRRRWAWLRVPSTRGAGALVAATAGAAAVVVLVVALASPARHQAAGTGSTTARTVPPVATTRRSPRALPTPATDPPPRPRPPTPPATTTPPPTATVPTPPSTTPVPTAPSPVPATPVPLPATPPSKFPVPAPSHTTVAVLNAARTAGLARREAARLTGAGYRVGVVANHPSGRLARSSVRYGRGQRTAAVALAARERIRRVLPLTGALRRQLGGVDVVIVLGADRR